MGLLYLFPVDPNEEHVKFNKNESSVSLTSYGLPSIFWLYLGLIIVTVVVMFIAIHDPLNSLLRYEDDQWNKIIVYSVYGLLVTIPFGFLSLFFYKKKIVKKDLSIQMVKSIFAIPFFKKSFQLNSQNSFQIDQHLGNPNIARKEAKEEFKYYQNKGYFELFGISKEGKSIFIDRSNNKSDLKKLIKLLTSSPEKK